MQAQYLFTVKVKIRTPHIISTRLRYMQKGRIQKKLISTKKMWKPMPSERIHSPGEK